MARRRRCPICHGPVAPRPANRSWPFCSKPCRLRDLGRWLGEGYRVAGDPAVGRAGGGAEGEEP